MDEDKQQFEKTVIIQDESLQQFQGGFTAIPNRILQNTSLTLGARMTYAMLLKYAWQEDFCFPAQESIAKDLGVTGRSVRTFLNELKEVGLINWKRQGLNKPNIYYILKLPETRSAKDQRTSGTENFSVPERKQTSYQERKQASYNEYSFKNTQNNVNVGLIKNEEKKAANDSDASDPDAGLLNEIIEYTGDTNPKSKGTLRKIIHGLGQGTAQQILIITKDAVRSGKCSKQKSAGYFVGAANNIAEERGIDLGFKNGAKKAQFAIANLKAEIGNIGTIRNLKSVRDDAE